MRIAVVSPFLDRRHGTERCIVEQLERFAKQPHAEIHVYAQRIDDIAAVRYPSLASGKIVWHKVACFPGPHLLNYIWWFLANHLQRAWDARFRGLHFDLLYSPGINAFHADLISIHVVFAELSARVRPQLRLRGSPISRWHTILHRRLYYRLIRTLEKRIYLNRRIALTAISQHTANSARHLFQRDDVAVIRYGVQTQLFDPTVRSERRQPARDALGVPADQFCLLLIANDWTNKGLRCLLEMMSALRELNLRLLIVGSDQRAPFDEIIKRTGLQQRVYFFEPSADIVQFYAAADVYVGPSLEDAYGLPILEAMACGLPVIASSRAGASEIIIHGENGMILQNPQDSTELASLVHELYSRPALCQQLAREARNAAELHTWDRNAAETWALLKKAAANKRQPIR